MGIVIRLGMVGAFLAAFTWALLQANLPPDKVALMLVACAALLVVTTALARHQKQHDLAAELTRLDTQRLHEPNEVLLSTVLRYVLWGIAALGAMALVKNLLVEGRPQPSLLLFVGLGVGCEYLRRVLRNHTGHWVSMRLRLVALTHRGLVAVISVDPRVGSESIRVQASYSRRERYGEHTRSEVLWRSPAVSIEPQRLSDRTEFHVLIAMPADFPDELERDEQRWNRGWHLAVNVSGSRCLNFNFKLPRSQA